MIKMSISSQKGGVGKSIITIVLANRLAFLKGYKVLIVDCDVPQISILSNLRTEIKILETIKKKKQNHEILTVFEKEFAKEFEWSTSHHKIPTGGKTVIEVISIDDPLIKRNFRNIDRISKNYDIVLYDLPGTLKEVHLLQEMLTFHYIFIPLEPNIASGSKSISTAAGLSILKNKLLDSANTSIYLKEIFLFFNKVNICSKQHRSEMNQLFTTAAKRGFKFLTKLDETPAFIDSRVLYQSELCSSLLFDTSRLLRYTKMETTIQLMTEIVANGTKK